MNEIADLINAARASRGLGSLQVDDRLTRAAQGHAVDMSQHPGMMHVGSDGADGGRRMQRAGYNWLKWGEVVGWGYDKAAPMVRWWLNSPARVGYLLGPDMEHIGVGYVLAPGTQYGHYWVVDFATGDDVTEWVYG